MTGIDEPDIEVAWESPPAAIRTDRNLSGVTGIWRVRLQPCLERPGEWLRFGPLPGRKTGERHAQNLKRGRIQIPAGKWQFTSRSDKSNDVSFMYARWLGGSGAHTKEEVGSDPVTSDWTPPKRRKVTFEEGGYTTLEKNPDLF